jgi:hypothetical protein
MGGFIGCRSALDLDILNSLATALLLLSFNFGYGEATD